MAKSNPVINIIRVALRNVFFIPETNQGRPKSRVTAGSKSGRELIESFLRNGYKDVTEDPNALVAVTPLTKLHDSPFWGKAKQGEKWVIEKGMALRRAEYDALLAAVDKAHEDGKGDDVAKAQAMLEAFQQLYCDDGTLYEPKVSDAFLAANAHQRRQLIPIAAGYKLLGQYEDVEPEVFDGDITNLMELPGMVRVFKNETERMWYQMSENTGKQIGVTKLTAEDHLLQARIIVGDGGSNNDCRKAFGPSEGVRQFGMAYIDLRMPGLNLIEGRLLADPYVKDGDKYVLDENKKKVPNPIYLPLARISHKWTPRAVAAIEERTVKDWNKRHPDVPQTEAEMDRNGPIKDGPWDQEKTIRHLYKMAAKPDEGQTIIPKTTYEKYRPDNKIANEFVNAHLENDIDRLKATADSTQTACNTAFKLVKERPEDAEAYFEIGEWVALATPDQLEFLTDCVRTLLTVPVDKREQVANYLTSRYEMAEMPKPAGSTFVPDEPIVLKENEK